jgi:radical SAM superfamily enzyme YgiQ (UPF0313 family)
MSVLLINPPFGTLDKPYLSIPVLASYLQSKNVAVKAVDANNEFYRRFLTRENTDHGRFYAEERLGELNERRELSFAGVMEYCRLVRALLRSHLLPDNLSDLFEHNNGLSYRRKLQALDGAIRLASAPYFPELIELPSYIAPFSEYSSHDIYLAACGESLLQKTFERILAPLLKDNDLKAVGISVCLPNQILPAFHCARVIKRIRPGMHVTVGGSIISCHMRNAEGTRLFEMIDSMVLDDGEVPLAILLQELSKREPDFAKAPGLVYLSDGKICRSQPVEPLDMQMTPAPDYEIFPLDNYLQPREDLKAPFRLSRGCRWGRCSFCRTDLSMVRHCQQPSADYLYTQLRDVVMQTGLRHFQFIDDSASPEILRALSQQLIDANLRITWFTNIRFSPRITSDLCSLLHRAGCRELKMGLECYNDRILRLMNKGTATKLIDRVLSEAARGGLPIHANMIVGFPTETEEEALSSFKRVWELYKNGLIRSYVYSPFQILPYSRIARSLEEYGITKVSAPEGQDLDPPVSEFEGKGMDWKKARELACRFNSSMVGATAPRTGDSAGATVVEKLTTTGGKELRLKHDLDEMRGILETAANSGISFGDLIRNSDIVYRS